MNLNKFFALIVMLLFISNTFGQNAGVTSIGSATACPNTIISIPVSVMHCPAITGISLSINYDGSVLSALQNGNTAIFLNNFNANLGTSNFNYAQSNKTGYPGVKQSIISWYALNSIQLDTNQSGMGILFNINFRYLGGTTSLTFDNSSQGGGECEYTDTLGNPFNDKPSSNYYISGTVSQCISGIANNNNDNAFTVSNFPNPFSQETTLEINTPEAGTVKIDIFNIFGECILNETENYYSRGKHKINLNMSEFAEGIYSYKVKYIIRGKVVEKTGFMNIVR